MMSGIGGGVRNWPCHPRQGQSAGFGCIREVAFAGWRIRVLHLRSMRRGTGWGGGKPRPWEPVGAEERKPHAVDFHLAEEQSTFPDPPRDVFKALRTPDSEEQFCQAAVSPALAVVSSRLRGVETGAGL